MLEEQKGIIYLDPNVMQPIFKPTGENGIRESSRGVGIIFCSEEKTQDEINGREC